MQSVYDFLKKVGTYYLATNEDGQPRVRPFGTVDLFEGKLYIQTGKVKEVSKQIAKNPLVELCAFDGENGCGFPADLYAMTVSRPKSTCSTLTRICRRCIRRPTTTPRCCILRTPPPCFPPSQAHRSPSSFKHHLWNRLFLRRCAWFPTAMAACWCRSESAGTGKASPFPADTWSRRVLHKSVVRE